MNEYGFLIVLQLVLQMGGSHAVSERLLISILSVSMDPCEMILAEAALSLAPLLSVGT